MSYSIALNTGKHKIHHELYWKDVSGQFIFILEQWFLINDKINFIEKIIALHFKPQNLES